MFERRTGGVSECASDKGASVVSGLVTSVLPTSITVCPLRNRFRMCNFNFWGQNYFLNRFSFVSVLLF